MGYGLAIVKEVFDGFVLLYVVGAGRFVVVVLCHVFVEESEDDVLRINKRELRYCVK